MKLQTKFLGILLPAGALAAALMLFLIQRSVHSVVIGGLERGASSLALTSTRQLAKGIVSKRELDLLPALQHLQLEEGALYAEVLDPQGKVLAHTTVTEKGKVEDDEFTKAALSSEEPMTAKGRIGAEPVLLLAIPIWPMEASSGEDFLLRGARPPRRWKRLGTLKLAIPLRAAQETETRILREISMIVLLTGAVALGLVVMLLRGMLAPIQQLMSGIARIGRGQFDVKVPVLSHDELGELAETFNIMSAELSRTTVSKEYVEGVLENMNDMLVVTDTEGRIQTLNRAAVETFGGGDALGRSITALFEEPPSNPAVRDAEVVIRTRNGGRIPALFSSSILRDRDGRVIGYIGVAKDITARKRNEEALLAAKLSAEASSRELETFSYSVAHDLRAPLRAIDGFSQLLLSDYSDKLDASGRGHLERVRAASGRMGILITDLLNLAKISRSVLLHETVDLSALAAAIGEELHKASPGRRVELIVAPGLKALGDPNLMRVALGNLLENAWKYTSKHPAARVEFGARDESGRTVYFVRDDGAGFDMALAARLFQPFTRFHAASDFEGTGIGLATVSRIVSRHGGRIWAESAVERGSVLYFTLWEGTD